MAMPVCVLGRVCADLYPLDLNTPLADVRRFERFAGGFAANVATGLARLGAPTAVVSNVGDDGFGVFVRRWLEDEGVDCSRVGVHPSLRTALAFCEAWPPDTFPITFYRTPTCPDWELDLDDDACAELAEAPILYAGGTALAVEPSSTSTLAALRAHGQSPNVTIFDLDWRPQLWDDPVRYVLLSARAVEHADIVLGGDGEIDAATGGAGVAALLASGPRAVVAKHGPDGASVHTAAGETRVPGLPVEVTNGLGAGDAFAAAFGASLLDDPDDLLRAARRGNAAGAIVATRLSCSAAMPRTDELEDLLRKA